MGCWAKTAGTAEPARIMAARERRVRASIEGEFLLSQQRKSRAGRKKPVEFLFSCFDPRDALAQIVNIGAPCNVWLWGADARRSIDSKPASRFERSHAARPPALREDTYLTPLLLPAQRKPPH